MKKNTKIVLAVISGIVSIVGTIWGGSILFNHADSDIVSGDTTVTGDENIVINGRDAEINISKSENEMKENQSISLTKPEGIFPNYYYCLIEDKFYRVDSFTQPAFCLTNNNTSYDIKIDNITVNVLDYATCDTIIHFGSEGAGAASVQLFECSNKIENKINSKHVALYIGEVDGAEMHNYGKYLKVSPGGLEDIAVNVTPEEPGIYTINMTINYTLKDETLSQNTEVYKFIFLGEGQSNVQNYQIPGTSGFFVDNEHVDEIKDYLNSLRPNSCGNWTFI